MSAFDPKRTLLDHPSILFQSAIVTGLTLSRVIRHYEPMLLRRAEQVFSNRPG